MSRTCLVACVSAGLCAACSESSLTEPAVRFQAVAVSAEVSRPFGGRCDTAFTFLAPLPGDPPNVQRVHIDYVCQLQHLGRTTGTADQIVVFTSATTLSASNTTTYTAANGDQLFASWTGIGTFDPATLTVTFAGPETYAGGTGRFINATGSTMLAGSASLAAATGGFTITGRLNY